MNQAQQYADSFWAWLVLGGIFFSVGVPAVGWVFVALAVLCVVFSVAATSKGG